MTEAQQLFIQKHKAFHAMREVVEGKAMTKEDWIILRLLMAGRATAAVTKKDYVLSILYLINKYSTKKVHDCIDQLYMEGRP
jgi:hypothetical protein